MTKGRTELLLVRHGRTAWHSPNRYTGRSDIDLDDVGRAQARTLGEWSASADLSALYCSPMVRTRATAAPVADATGLQPITRDELRETDFGIAEGKTLEEVAEEDPAAARAFLDDPIGGHWPGGDDPAVRATEAAAALATVAGEHTGERVMVVAHSTLLRLLLCQLLRIPLAHYRFALARPEPAAVSVLLWDGGPAPTLTAFNVPAGAISIRDGA
jgi:probable phosphoglycerate mutase